MTGFLAWIALAAWVLALVVFIREDPTVWDAVAMIAATSVAIALSGAVVFA